MALRVALRGEWWGIGIGAMERDGSVLPHAAGAPDVFRNGPLQELRAGVRAAHPAEALERASLQREAAAREAQLAGVYGAHAVMRARMEAGIVGRVGRLPGLPSSRLGAEVLSGKLDTLGFEDFLNVPDGRPEAPDPRHQLEVQFGLAKR